ncbi:MAG TPA: hypothetical protein VK886_01245 [Vicinamibacterales bacterium]|nr:hypothetical protein [Vicinamibacterales bacterium]
MNSRLVRRGDLTRADRDAMLALLSEHFEGIERPSFDRDLDEKNWVLLFTDEEGLKGFTTMLAYETQHRGERISVIYSGDTIMARDGWRTSTLPRAWGRAVRDLRGGLLRGARLYWLLLTSGFRTYRLLPVFWREFYPRQGAPTPPEMQALLDDLAAERFGRLYEPAAGIVRFPRPQVLREELADISAGRLQDTDVAFFAARNPGWRRGDELVCVTEVCLRNLTPAGRRMWLHPGEEALERVG